MNQADVNMNATELLARISQFSAKVSCLTVDYETSKSAYIYAYLGDEDAEVEFYLSTDLEFIVNNTNKDIADFLLKTYEPNKEFSKDFLEEFEKEVENNFYIQYQKLYKEKEDLERHSTALGFDPNIFENLLAGATEFYESSRCW